MRQLKLITAALFLISSFAANAGIILVDESDASRQINATEPVGQSFTAEDSSVLIAFSFFDVNDFVGPNLALTMRLLEGDGVSGIELLTVSQVLTAGLGSGRFTGL